MSKFRKKPVVIEAHQFGGTVSSADAIIAWAGMEPRPNEQALDYSVLDNEGTFRDRIERPQQFGPLVIHTLEGDMTAQEGDWIIKGVKGEFYPCKPDIFAATYEPVGPVSPVRDPAPPDADGMSGADSGGGHGGAHSTSDNERGVRDPSPPEPCEKCDSVHADWRDTPYPHSIQNPLPTCRAAGFKHKPDPMDAQGLHKEFKDRRWVVGYMPIEENPWGVHGPMDDGRDHVYPIAWLSTRQQAESVAHALEAFAGVRGAGVVPPDTRPCAHGVPRNESCRRCADGQGLMEQFQ